MNEVTDGARLCAVRKARGMNQIAMAQALGLALGHLQQLEQDHPPVTAAVRAKLEHAFGLGLGLGLGQGLGGSGGSPVAADSGGEAV